MFTPAPTPVGGAVGFVAGGVPGAVGGGVVGRTGTVVDFDGVGLPVGLVGVGVTVVGPVVRGAVGVGVDLGFVAVGCGFAGWAGAWVRVVACCCRWSRMSVALGGRTQMYSANTPRNSTVSTTVELRGR